MQSLTERLYNNNVLFSYYGFIDSKVLQQVLQITRNKLENNNESAAIIERVHNALNDCVENIIEHNFFPADAFLSYKSLLLVSTKNNSYFIDTINVINSVQKESINRHLVNLNSHTREQLNELKSGIIEKNSLNSLAEGTGLGLIDLVLVSDSCNYRFKDYDSNFLFNINFEISSLN